MLGLGPLDIVGLADARERARRIRLQLLDGIDPLAERQAQKAERAAQAVPLMTFAKAATQYHREHEKKWHAKHRFLVLLEQYAFPVIGSMDVRVIGTDDVLRVLQPHWATRTESMTKLRGYISTVMAWSIVSGHRTADDPAVWRGWLALLLPAPSKIAPVVHLPALPYSEMPSFMAELRQVEGVPARALEFVVLTATRTSECLGAKWSEVSLEDATWVIPGSRTKTGQTHRVALSEPAVELLKALPKETDNPFIFAGRVRGRGLGSNVMMDVLRKLRPGDITVHGFRSTFRDWCAETTGHDNHVRRAGAWARHFERS